MTALAQLVRRGATRGPQRIVLHGPEGVGKTTFAAGAPNPIFLGTEDGFGDLDVARLPAPGSWPALLGYVEQITEEAHDFRTLVLDTVDHIERLLWGHLCEEAERKTIEEVGGGFGKGYVAAAEEFGRLTRALDHLRDRRRMHVLALAHSHIKTFKNPDGTDYDRYELRMQKQAAALWREWPDVLLFANWDVRVATAEWSNKNDKKLLSKGKAADDGKRRLYTTRAPQFDAKNRYSLPEELDLSWVAFARAMQFDAIEQRLTKPTEPTRKPETTQDPDAAFVAALAKLEVTLTGDHGLDAYRTTRNEGPALKLDRDGRANLYRSLAAKDSPLLAAFRAWAKPAPATVTTPAPVPAPTPAAEDPSWAADAADFRADLTELDVSETELAAYLGATGQPAPHAMTSAGRANTLFMLRDPETRPTYDAFVEAARKAVAAAAK